MLIVDQNRFSIGKDIYYPFSVEMHYFRVEKRYWSICFERIKRAGFRIISTAVPWNLHQDKNKDIDFNGFQDPRKDLVVFLELAREFGFKVILRPGPWIAGQWRNGGYPDFVLRDPRLIALNAAGNAVDLDDAIGVPGGKLVSYLHPNFQHYLKNYLKNLIETTRNYIHPRGPVFMVEFDFETSFCHKTGPGDADYNPYVVETLYPAFLEQKYGEISSLNAVYKEKHKSFAEVQPPREFAGAGLALLPRYFDWFHFKEWYLSEFLTGLEELFKSYTVLPMFFRSLYFEKGHPLPEFSLATQGEEQHLVGAAVFPEGSVFDLTQKARYMRTMTDFSWAPSFTSGSVTANRQESELMFPITDGRRRFFVTAGLASGFKGLNHYMFVNRDHWYGAPVDGDGTIGSGFEIIRRLNIAIPKMEVNALRPDQAVAAAFHRPYQWMTKLPQPKEFGYMWRLLHETYNGVCRDFGRLGFDYGVGDIAHPEKLEKFKMVFIPVAEVLATEVQEQIVSLAEKGVNIVLVGLLPHFDEMGREHATLSKLLHMKTTPAESIVEVDCGRGHCFTAYQYGTIRTTDPKTKTLATAKGKPVGVVSTHLKGKVFLYTIDLASGGDFRKLYHLEAILNEAKVATPVYVSDPNIGVVLQRGDKAFVIFILAPPAGELDDATDIRTKEILLRVDLRQVGFKGAKIKLVDQLAAEEEQPIATTVEELKNGIVLRMEFPDGKIFLVEKM
jgi:beta-galactosidase